MTVARPEANVTTVLAILFAACAVSFAQIGPAGTWRVDGVGQSFPWKLLLKVDGTMLSGGVSSCASVQGAFPIEDGRTEGSKLSFKCRSGDGQRTITFAGNASAGHIDFTWELQNQNANPPVSLDGMFGNSAPRRFSAKRVPEDEEFTKDVDDALRYKAERAAKAVPANEYAASVNVIPKGVKAQGRIFIPRSVRFVRSVIVVIEWGVGPALYDDPKWRQLALALQSGMLLTKISPIDTDARIAPLLNSAEGVDSVLMLLRRLAQESGHQELANAPVLLWGHSAVGVFESTFASAHPDRTIGVILYHAGGPPMALSKIPTLILKGGKDNSGVGLFYQGPADSVDDANSGRAVGAPWTFSLDPDATHGDEEFLNKADDLMIPWVTSVVHQRIGTASRALRGVPDRAGWLGDNRTGEVASYPSFAGAKATASWLPDESSARAWQALLGKTKPATK